MSADAPEPTLPPLTIERVAARLDARGSVYGRDSDGDLVGRWDGHPFWFITMGRDKEYFQVRGRWARQVPSTEFGNVLLGANAWSETMVWPKLYVRIEMEQVARVHGAHRRLRARRERRAAGPADHRRDRQRPALLRASSTRSTRTPRQTQPVPPPAAPPVSYSDPARPTID